MKTETLSAPRSTGRAWLAPLLIGALALLPRTIGLADFFTIDEPYHWIGRVQRFSAALHAGDWARTNQTGHPGVTTMWLGALGEWLGALGGIHDPGWAGGGADYLAALRLPVAVVNSLVVVLGYLALRRLLRSDTALLAGLLWAASPFLVAHSRLLHLDALLTSFVTLSLLLLLCALHEVAGRRQSVLLAGSGACAGLALLTKAPSLIWLPLAGLLMLALGPGALGWPRLRGALVRYIAWLGCAALVVLIGWPALWVAPLQALGGVVREVVKNGGQPTDGGNFFMGQPVAAPDWRFYPAVVLWRATPEMLLGLALLPLALRDRAERRTLLALLGFALGFALALSLEPKQFDRYLLPIWPALIILAAAGLAALARLVASWVGLIGDRGRPGIFSRLRALRGPQPAAPPGQTGPVDHPKLRLALAGAAWVVATFGLAANLAWYHPYELGYFNPLLGGGAVAQQVLLAGWGEGMEQVGAWLRTRPDLRRGPVLSWIPPTLAPFVPAEVPVLDLRPQYLEQASSYAVLYVRSVQRKESAVAEHYVRESLPLYTVRAHGIVYATIHQLPRPYTTPVGAVFGDGLHLRGFSQELLGNTLVITPSWDIQADQQGGVFCFVHVIDDLGQRVAQVDAPLDQGMFGQWQAGQQFDSPLPLALPPNLPPGRYRVVMGLYRPEGGARLPVAGVSPLPPAIDGPQVIELTALRLGSSVAGRAGE